MKDVDKKSIVDIAKELVDLATRTRDRKVALDELQGGTFTVSNQGGIGGGAFTPIVNHPEVAILGMARGKKKPLFVDGKVEERMVLPLALSYDHRLIDGGDAARFITEFVSEIENLDESKF